jgi:soluble lytic murein transglycosylase-like protein
MKKFIIVPILGMCMFTSACTSFTAKSETINHKSSIEEKIYVKALLYDVPHNLAYSVVKVESRLMPHVIGKDGTYGLGQIKCSTARGIGFKGECKKLLDPDTNLEYTMLYLKKALELSKGNECHAATLYNRGLMNKPKSSTYCRKVLSYYK